jgi:hypothetical protein
MFIRQARKESKLHPKITQNKKLPKRDVYKTGKKGIQTAS